MKTEPTTHRIYLSGNTYPVRDEIKAAGGKWDEKKKAWWVTPDLRPQMIRLAAKVRNQPKEKRKPMPPPGDHDQVIGEALSFTDKEPYLIGWLGRLKNGPQAGAMFAKLITMDGNRALWKPAKEIKVLRRFDEPQPLGHILQQLAHA